MLKTTVLPFDKDKGQQVVRILRKKITQYLKFLKILF